MLIYVFLEHYPSPFKAYFDTQFEQFLSDGHRLQNFSFGRSPGAIPEKVGRLGLDRATRYLPSVLSQVPALVGALLANVFRSPVAVTGNCWRALRGSRGLKQAFLAVVRTALLPGKKPDLCFVHNLIAQRNLLFLRRVYPGVPIAFYYHGGEVPGVPTVGQQESAAAFAAADVVFTNTQDSRQHAIERGCTPDKIVISPMGFNLAEFVPAPDRSYRRDGRLNLLTISRLSEEKGLIYAIEAIRLLRERGIRDLRLRIIGGGPLDASLRARVQALELSEQVQFLGVVSFAEIHEQLGHADALLLPSIVLGTWQENQACVVQEAMLMRTLVATSTAGGVPESTAPELRQFSFPPGDAAALAEVIARLGQLDLPRMRELGEAGRRFAVEHYDIVSINRRLLERVLATRPS